MDGVGRTGAERLFVLARFAIVYTVLSAETSAHHELSWVPSSLWSSAVGTTTHLGQLERTTEEPTL